MEKCDCGTKDRAASVWCYIHGYLIKPSIIHRKPKSNRRSLEYKQAMMARRAIEPSPTAKTGL
jgi:hypothetical protein